MMPKSVVVSDSSCLIVLKRINRLILLQQLFEVIYITSEVYSEVGEVLPDWIIVKKANNINLQHALELELDSGEASSLALCSEFENSLLIIDERRGRLIAQKMKQQIRGTLGLFLDAKEKGIISTILPILIEMENEGFRISSELKFNVLKLAGE